MPAPAAGTRPGAHRGVVLLLLVLPSALVYTRAGPHALMRAASLRKTAHRGARATQARSWRSAESRALSDADAAKLFHPREPLADARAQGGSVAPMTTEAPKDAPRSCTGTAPETKVGPGARPTDDRAAARAVWTALHRGHIRLRVTPPLLDAAGKAHGAVPLLLNRHMFEHVSEHGVPTASSTVSVRPTSLLGGSKAWPEFRLTFEELALSNLPEQDPGTPANRFRYRSCAVVGNSGRLLHARHGAEIDAHNAVFRINYAPTVGFEEYVGNKTSFDVCNHVHAREFVREGRRQGQQHPAGPDDAPTNSSAWRSHAYTKLSKRSAYRPSTLILFEVLEFYGKNLYGQLHRKLDSLARAAGIQPQNGLNERVMIFSPHLAMHAKAVWTLVRGQLLRWQASPRGGRSLLAGDERTAADAVPGKVKATSGWYAVFFAAQVCESVSIYGMSGFSGEENHWSETSRYHYFDDVSAVLSAHNFDVSYGALQAIAEYPCSDVTLRIVD